jgi:hypothetical protein
MRHLNWKNDRDSGVIAWASRSVGGRYRVSRHEGVGGVWFEAEHVLVNGNNKPIRPIARTLTDAIATAEADNDRRRTLKERAA